MVHSILLKWENSLEQPDVAVEVGTMSAMSGRQIFPIHLPADFDFSTQIPVAFKFTHDKKSGSGTTSAGIQCCLKNEKGLWTGAWDPTQDNVIMNYYLNYVNEDVPFAFTLYGSGHVYYKNCKIEMTYIDFAESGQIKYNYGHHVVDWYADYNADDPYYILNLQNEPINLALIVSNDAGYDYDDNNIMAMVRTISGPTDYITLQTFNLDLTLKNGVKTLYYITLDNMTAESSELSRLNRFSDLCFETRIGFPYVSPSSTDETINIETNAQVVTNVIAPIWSGNLVDMSDFTVDNAGQHIYDNYGFALQNFSNLSATFEQYVTMDSTVSDTIISVAAKVDGVAVPVVLEPDIRPGHEGEDLWTINIGQLNPTISGLTYNSQLEIFITDKYDVTTRLSYNDGSVHTYYPIPVRKYSKPVIRGQSESQSNLQRWRYNPVDYSQEIDDEGEFIYATIVANISPVFEATDTTQNVWRISSLARADGETDKTFELTNLPAIIPGKTDDYVFKNWNYYEILPHTTPPQYDSYRNDVTWDITLTIYDQFSYTSQNFSISKAGGVFNIERYGIGIGIRTKGRDGSPSVDSVWPIKSNSIYVGNKTTNTGLYDLNGVPWIDSVSDDTGWVTTEGIELMDYGSAANDTLKIRRIKNQVFIGGSVHIAKAVSSTTAATRYKIGVIKNTFAPSRYITLPLSYIYNESSKLPIRGNAGYLDTAIVIDPKDASTNNSEVFIYNNTGTQYSTSHSFAINFSYLND